ncbi:MAG TPA: universal stress protein [Methanomassiliicoccales archaeon]|jgi:nucleotide-binding universal stress UspA family protein|nr:universal stress protein [Methanomassiliicoccales archaeon]
MEGKQLRLLVAVDGSVHGEKALRKAALLALSAPSYEIAVVCVVEVREFASLMAEADTEEMEVHAKKVLQDSLEILTSEGVVAVTHLLHGPPVTKILEFAETFHPDLIVTGSRGMGAAKGALIGSVSSSLSKRASTSVLIVR